jgi:hypothetical protein
MAKANDATLAFNIVVPNSAMIYPLGRFSRLPPVLALAEGASLTTVKQRSGQCL